MQLLTPAQLSALLDKSRTANLHHGITGMLLYNAGSFMQTIEGPEAAIRQLYLNICRDPSHHMVTTLLDEQLTERSFPEWSMGFRDVTGYEPPFISGYTDFLRQSDTCTFKNDASLAKRLLANFRENGMRG